MSVVEYVEIPEGLEKIFPIVKELRPHLEFAEFKRLVSLAHAADGYRLVAREVKGQVVAVMGFRILHDLVHGSHLYVDDLVVTKDERSSGHGAQLLRFAEGEARRLDQGPQRGPTTSRAGSW
ncbi:MAG: GNAT family N-acetyltransferase, partial [Bdellovibrionota bacterium]